MQAVDKFTRLHRQRQSVTSSTLVTRFFTNDIVSFKLKDGIAREARIDHTGSQGTRAMTKRCIP